jgi:phage terminase large subunit-like protein
MARIRVELEWFPRQRQIVSRVQPGARLLVPCEARSGGSHLLRLVALSQALKQRCRVLVVRLHLRDVRETHLCEGTGLVALTRGLQAAGKVNAYSELLRVNYNEASITWTGCSTLSELNKLSGQNFDVVLIDDAHEISEPTFERLKATLNGSQIGILVAVTKRVDGWMEQRFDAVEPMQSAHIATRLNRAKAPATYSEWLESVHGGKMARPPHVVAMIDGIDRWIRNEFDHLAIFIPSQHGKTNIGPRNAVPYILSRYPADWCAVISYSATVAESRSSDARANFVLSGGRLSPDKQAAERWMTLGGGGCWAAGSDGGIIGNTANAVFMDDPDKDWLDAINRERQNRKHQIYGSSIRSRESVFAADERRQKLCITATRWDPRDFASYCLTLGEQVSNERWAILVLPALYDPEIPREYALMYPKAIVLPDWRTEKGEPIMPARRSREDWDNIKILRGPQIFECESQQRAKGIQAGGKFDSATFKLLATDPAFLTEKASESTYRMCCRAWDLAATEGAGDWTAGAKLGHIPDWPIVVRHVVRAQLGEVGVRQLIAAAMICDGPSVKIRLPKDPATGKTYAEGIVRYLHEVAIRAGVQCPEIVLKPPIRAASATDTAKANRAKGLISVSKPVDEQSTTGGLAYVDSGWSPSVEDRIENYAKRVQEWPELKAIAEKGRLLAAVWQPVWAAEMHAFTGADGMTDDQVDATVDASEELYQVKKETVFHDIHPAWA